MDKRNRNRKEDIHLQIDFAATAFRKRLKQEATSRSLLARAVGWKRNPTDSQQKSYLLDLTAGLGRDAAIFAHLGFKVVALERNPVLFQQLIQAQEQARVSEFEEVVQIAEKIKFINIDAKDHLQSFSQQNSDSLSINYPDIIYYDPMLEEQAQGRSLPKKETQYLRQLNSPTSREEQMEIVRLAIPFVQRRMIVKRPLKEHYIGRGDFSRGFTHHYLQSKTLCFEIWTRSSMDSDVEKAQ